MNSTLIEVFQNAPEDMQSHVYENTKGKFTVTLRDLDSGEWLPTSYGFDTLGAAIAKAKQIAGLE